jgi:hypothetical protein
VTTLTATPSGITPGAVLLEVDATPTDAPVVLTRVDANGAAPVRLLAGLVPISGSLTVVDHEAALSGIIRYDVIDSADVTTTDTTTLEGTVTGPRIASVQLPSRSTAPRAATGYESRRTSPSVVHWVEGRADPVVILRPARTREGSLTLLAASYEDAHDMMDTVAPGVILLLRQPDHPGMDMYFVVLDVEPTPEELTDAGWVWTVRASYVEVKAPAVPLLGSAGWTFADLTAGYPTFSAARAAFVDFGALTVGPL